jgi:hypothetical protein
LTGRSLHHVPELSLDRPGPESVEHDEPIARIVCPEGLEGLAQFLGSDFMHITFVEGAIEILVREIIGGSIFEVYGHPLPMGNLHEMGVGGQVFHGILDGMGLNCEGEQEAS